MSAFIVSRKHIEYLVTAGRRYEVINGNPDETGQQLWDENIKSVEYRYHDKLPGPIGETYKYKHAGSCRPIIDPVSVIKQCQCYSYQASEHPGWEKSQAKRIVDEIKLAAIQRLPGYDAAPWGID